MGPHLENWGADRDDSTAAAQDDVLRRPPWRGTRLLTGVLGLGVFALLSYPVAHSTVSQWSIRSESSVTHEFEAGVPVVGAVAESGTQIGALVHTERAARGAPVRLVFTRRCLLPVAATVVERTVPEPPRSAGTVEIAPAPWWARCSGQGTWSVPPETGVHIRTYDGEADLPSIDAAAREAVTSRRAELNTQAQALRVQQERLRRAEAAARKAQATTAARLKKLEGATRSS